MISITIIIILSMKCKQKYSFTNLFYNKIYPSVPPLRPELEFSPRARNGAYEIDQQLQARCISRDGRPPATLSWWLDDEQLHEGLALPEVLETHAPNNTTLYTISQVATVRIQANLDRKHLICRAAHQTDHGNPQEAHLQLQVKCRYKTFAKL